MAKVVSSFTSALPNCILPRVMGLVHIALDMRSSVDMYKTHQSLILWKIQQGRADMQDDTTLAML